ncbi:efflux RND transporter periplasmic adaptor subunit [Desulfogranum japonicum]|uniref:efflux RND transporter periplasmic adaptor subunit n=1 Tax=Desulfogranum japonicum TaxID=231447 RepID=UPI0004034624|nr:efflux RND transporter periplasmic adaptor subunit [Desulfogranum japonicum]
MRALPVVFAFIFLIFSQAFAQDQPPALVKTTQIIQEDVAKNKPFIGLFYYDRVSQVSSEVAGLAATIEAQLGDRIQKGQPLVRLNTDLLETDIQLAHTRIKQSDLEAELAAKDFERQESLLKKRGASQKNYDDASFSLSNARMEKQASRQTLAKLNLQKEKSTITAPFDGIVLEKQVEVGDWVQQGNPVMTVGSTNDLFIKVPVGETLLQFIAEGQQVNIVITAFNKEITGTVATIDPRADERTKNIFIKIRVPAQENVAENMSATVYLPISKKQKLSILPRAALIKHQGKDFVYTIKDGKATILPVNIVTYLGDKIAADNPYLAPGMPVIIEGNERLRPDQPVTLGQE